MLMSSLQFIMTRMSSMVTMAVKPSLTLNLHFSDKPRAEAFSNLYDFLLILCGQRCSLQRSTTHLPLLLAELQQCLQHWHSAVRKCGSGTK